MIELYNDISVEVRELAESIWRLAQTKNNPIDAAKFIVNTTEYYTDTLTERELEFLRFYFYTQLELMSK